MRAQRGDNPATAALLALAAGALGTALQRNNGMLDPVALVWLAAAFGLTLLALLFGPRLPTRGTVGDRLAAAALGLALTGQLGQLLTSPPAMYLRRLGPLGGKEFLLGLAIAAVLAFAGLAKPRWWPRARTISFLSVVALLGLWLLYCSPNPDIDVVVFQRDSAAALLSGHNPYAITFRDIYGNSPFYGPGLSVGGRLQVGYPYMPLSLLLALPGHLAGDFRLSQLASAVGAAALMMAARPGRLAAGAAALFLLTPRFFFVLEGGWTEPYAVLLLCATVACACRRPRLLPWSLGLLLAVKQHLLLAAPLSLLLFPRPLPPFRELVRFYGKVALIATAVTLPLALWNLPAFFRDVVVFQIGQPFRWDSLSLLAWLAQGKPAPPSFIAFAVLLLAAALALWKAPRTPAGFALSVAFTSLAFFATSKQAFCNYYYFVVGALACAAAASEGPVRVLERPSPTPARTA